MGVSMDDYQSIRLDQLEKVLLMNRVDRKYCIPVTLLQDLLDRVQPFYYCLEIDRKRIFKYKNTYYDNNGNMMYNDHLRGKMNRYKVRVREYDDSGGSYLEVKFKNNKGKTMKSRIRCNGSNSIVSGTHSHFLLQHIPFKPGNLSPVLTNSFRRVTLVNKDFQERCTIDFDLSFRQNGISENLDRIAIIEVKTETLTHRTPVLSALRDIHCKTKGFSKYCFGRSLLDNTLKNNRYLPKIRSIDKLQMTDKNNL